MKLRKEPDADERGGKSDMDEDDRKRSKRGQPFYGAKGSDQNAPMKGDFQQQVTKSTAPGTKVVKRRPVKTGGAYRLPRQRRA